MHSRAAKRASSPSIDTDKSLKDVKPPVDTRKQRPSVLAIHQGAGISKKSKNGRKSVLSTKARRRQEKGLDRAEAAIDKAEKKIQRSKGKAKSGQERSKAWDDVNKTLIVPRGNEAIAVNSVPTETELSMEGIQEVMQENEQENISGADDMDVQAVAQSIPLPDPLAEEEKEL